MIIVVVAHIKITIRYISDVILMVPVVHFLLP